MSGVWNFNSNGVLNLVENPLAESSSPGPSSGHKILVHIASNETMSSFEQLDTKLRELGWQLYSRSQDTRQYHRSHNTCDLITLPFSFACCVHDENQQHVYNTSTGTLKCSSVDSDKTWLPICHYDTPKDDLQGVPKNVSTALPVCTSARLERFSAAHPEGTIAATTTTDTLTSASRGHIHKFAHFDVDTHDGFLTHGSEYLVGPHLVQEEQQSPSL